MADLGTLRRELGDVLRRVDGLRVYDYVPDSELNVPCAIVRPTAGDNADTFQRGHRLWTFEVILAASRADDRGGQRILDELLSDGSVRTVLEAARTTGIAGGHLDVNGWSDYGVSEFAGSEFYTATFPVEVHTT